MEDRRGRCRGVLILDPDWRMTREPNLSMTHMRPPPPNNTQTVQVRAYSACSLELRTSSFWELTIPPASQVGDIAPDRLFSSQPRPSGSSNTAESWKFRPREVLKAFLVRPFPGPICRLDICRPGGELEGQRRGAPENEAGP